MRYGVLLIAACALLSACASPAEIAAKKAAAEQMAQAARGKRCASFGYQQGTPAYSHCLENMYVQDRQMAEAEEANRIARNQAQAQALERAGAALQSINPPPPPPPPPMFNPPIHCNTIGTSTTCF